MKPTVEVGTHKIEHPGGLIELRPYFRAQGAGVEPYPHDPTDHDLLVREAKRRATAYFDDDTPVATKVAIEQSMITALEKKGWTPG